MSTVAGDDRLPAVQSRTVRLLVAAQVLSGVGIGSAVSVGGILALQLSGSEVFAGGAGTAMTLGAALVAVPLARLARARGRRVSLASGWAVAALGGLTTIASTVLGLYPVMVLGVLMFGVGSAAGLQSRYAAIDLAPPGRRAKDLSLVVWSTTVGSVLGPNLSEPGAVVGRALGIPEIAGPFVFSIAGFVLAAVLVTVLMRPDPLLLARSGLPPETGTAAGSRWSSLSVVAASPRATLAVAAVVLGHAVMVAVMTMTPVHLTHHGAGLSVVGLTISLHIAGMYALSPVFGALADRFGRVPVLVGGQVALVVAALVAGTAGASRVQLTAGLVLLGLGWSAGLVAGSALVAESVPAAVRPDVQGTSDLLMNLAGALGAATSGVTMGLLGFPGLGVATAVLAVPVLLLAVRATRLRSSGTPLPA